MRVRPRRLRRTAAMRAALAETDLRPQHLIQPHFVVEDDTADVPIDALPGIHRMGLDALERRVADDRELGIDSVLLFGVHADKDPLGSPARTDDNMVARAVRRLRAEHGDELVIMTDVCLCGATDHGHCGVLRDGEVENDASLPLLADMALSHARAGADVVAPSDMMDGRVAAMRDALDGEGLTSTAILSYSTKFASAFYGPFRAAADSAPQSGDRRSYQLDHRNAREATRESAIDAAEGADMVMVKPALSYLDVIARVAEEARVPVAAYNVSGEFGMVKAAAERGWADEAAVVREILHSIRRAGADLVISYHAREALAGGWLR